MSDSPRLAVVSQEFPPDMSGLASRMRDLTTNLDDEGWEVDVITPPPSFPHGEFERRWYRSEQTQFEGVTVNRIWAWQPDKADPSTLSRLALYLTFSLHATLWLLYHVRRYDVVLTTTPPIFTGLAGFLPSRLGVKWVVDVRDLWIDAAVSLGFLERGSLLERVSRAFQRAVLHNADLVTLTTETLGERLCESYGHELEAKVVVVPNGVDMSRFGVPSAIEGGTTSGDGADDRPVIVYVGNIGHAQALDTCIEAMARIEHDAVLRLIGAGDARPALKRLVESEGLEDRVEFVDPVPREDVPGILQQADIGVAPLINDEGLAYAMPTKVYEYLGSGLPIVVTGQGELERFVTASGSGRCVDADPGAVAAALDELLDDERLQARLGRSGYNHVKTRYDRRRIVAGLDETLRELLGGTDLRSGRNSSRDSRVQS